MPQHTLSLAENRFVARPLEVFHFTHPSLVPPPGIPPLSEDLTIAFLRRFTEHIGAPDFAVHTHTTVPNLFAVPD